MKNFFKKFRSYSFWVSLSGAVIILLNAFGRAFGFKIENQIVEDCIMAVAGLLVVLGFCFKAPKEEEQDLENQNSKSQEEENLKDLNSAEADEEEKSKHTK